MLMMDGAEEWYDDAGGAEDGGGDREDEDEYDDDVGDGETWLPVMSLEAVPKPKSNNVTG